MMIRLKLQAAASVPPVGAISCTRAKQREAACAAQAEGGSSGRDDERAVAAVGGERDARRAMSCMRAERREAACADRRTMVYILY